ncbi:hypothetical protein GCM10010400_70060 [Streptomyces aculeolatus]|uniref:hypothetical protein n=1 Tax=Streptomyces aculeolatus TaxID=270689 RepID=UPI001CED59A1|nr:hypothetical protein [Streptomyces aculeolatus]
MSYPYPPPPPPPPPPGARRSRGKTILLSVLGVFAFLIAVSMAAAALGGGGAEEPGTSSSAPAAPAKGDDKPPPKEKPEAKEKSEADDLTSINLDDRSEYGVPDIWVTYTIRNNSSKTSNYEVSYEVVDSSGTRVYNSVLWVTDVQPGQTDKGEDYTTLETMEGMKLNVTGLDRMESF